MIYCLCIAVSIILIIFSTSKSAPLYRSSILNIDNGFNSFLGLNSTSLIVWHHSQNMCIRLAETSALHLSARSPSLHAASMLIEIGLSVEQILAHHIREFRHKEDSGSVGTASMNHVVQQTEVHIQKLL